MQQLRQISCCRELSGLPHCAVVVRSAFSETRLHDRTVWTTAQPDCMHLAPVHLWPQTDNKFLFIVCITVAL